MLCFMNKGIDHRPKILFSDPINNIFARILAYQRQNCEN